MAMEKISVDKAIGLAKSKKLKPAKVIGTDGIQFTRGKNANLEVITWDEFKDAMKKRKLAVYQSGGWMKIMKK